MMTSSPVTTANTAPEEGWQMRPLNEVPHGWRYRYSPTGDIYTTGVGEVSDDRWVECRPVPTEIERLNADLEAQQQVIERFKAGWKPDLVYGQWRKPDPDEQRPWAEIVAEMSDAQRSVLDRGSR